MESIYHTFENTAKRVPHKSALVYLGEDYSYAELLDAIDGVAASLSDLGVKKNHKVILFLPNCPQWVIIWFALQKVGATAVPITPYYGLNDLAYIANDVAADTIFCLDTNFGYVTRVMPDTSLKRVIVTTMVDVLPLWKRVLGRALDKVPEGTVDLDENILTFDRLLKGGDGRCAACEPSADDEIADILYTGGTTGRPKGVPISHALFLESARAHRQNSQPLIPFEEDVVLQGAPLYHILGQVLGLGALLHGDRVILLPRINLDAMFDHIQRYQVKTFFGVPAMYRRILEHDRLHQYDLGSLKYCFSGGDVLPGEVARRWQKQFDIPINQGYGTTETCGGVSLTPVDEPFPAGTVGRIVSFQKVKIVDPETLEPVPEGEPGEILVSSQHMVDSYWNKPDETQRFFVRRDGRLWYRTSDIVRLDEEGWLFFHDRAADLIKHKGYRVAASRVEAILQEHHAVIASCVVGIPDTDVGERVKAFVVLKEDVKGVTAHDLTRWCRQRLASYEVPHYIEFRDMLPKSKVGKLLRRELRAEEQRRKEIA